ncbi:MAG TPA: AAA family ATPase [Bryobacteraceae bacterium]|nr:AAA family ATPase [Bryobacteraceae bacterium]
MKALVVKYEPQKISDFVGIEVPKAVLSKLIADPYESGFLLLGPSGLGKTTMAMVVAKAIGGKLHHISAAKCTVEVVEQLVCDCQYAPMGGGRWHVAIVDECDSMSAQAQKSFLSILDTAAMPRDTIFLMTSNDTRLLHPRFLSRLRRLDFKPPTVEEQTAFLARVWKKEKGGRRPDFAEIVRASGGNIRNALMILETELLVPGSFVPPPVQSIALVRSGGEPVIEVDENGDHPRGCPCKNRKCSARRAWVTMRRNMAETGRLKKGA